MDEPESIGGLTLAAREKLDNLIFVVNCNLQRLDGLVRSNHKIVQELEGVFRGAGWNVIKVLWDSRWDQLFAKDKNGALVKRLGEVVDGGGDSVDDGNIVFGPAPEQMSIGIEGDLDPGFYTVVWESLSSVDGHLFKGSFPFTVLNEDGSQPSGPRFEASGGGSASTEPQNIIVKWAQVLAGAMLLGGLAFLLLINRPATKSLENAIREDSRSATWRHLRLLAWPAVAVLALTGAASCSFRRSIGRL
jgi:hypothetical protein